MHDDDQVFSLDPRPDAPGAARAYVSRMTRDVDLSERTRADLELLVSELVTNAVVHAGTPLELSVIADDCVRVMVRDAAGGEPRITARAVGGWGLRMVDQRSAQWGVLPADPGKIVWFDLPIE